MEYLRIEAALIVVRRLRRVSEYIPGSGARCTLCGEWNRVETGLKTLKSGSKRRYHVCVNCGHKFPSEERSEYSDEQAWKPLPNR